MNIHMHGIGRVHQRLFGLIASAVLVFSTLEQASSGAQIECGCPAVGDYVDPAGIVVAEEELPSQQTSPHGVYRATVTGTGPRTIQIVRISDGAVVLTLPSITSLVGYGFSPHDDGFIYADANASTKTAYLFNLVGLDPSREVARFSLDVSSAVIGFSPHGQYFLSASVINQSQVRIIIVDSASGTPRLDQTFASLGAPAGSGEEYHDSATWGFSPDSADRTFVYAFVSAAPRTVEWNLVNLERAANVRRETLEVTQGVWQFSPCGDVISLDVAVNQRRVRLFRTLTGAAIDQAERIYPSNNPVDLHCNVVSHVLTDVNGNDDTLAPNTADDPCPPDSLPPVVGWDPLSSRAVEGGAAVTIYARLNRPATSEVRVSWDGPRETADVSIVGSQPLTIPAGQISSSAVTVTAKTDPVSEPNESVVLTLSTPMGAALAEDRKVHTVTIVDANSSSPPEFSFADVSTVTFENAPQHSIKVRLSRPVQEPTSVQWNIVDRSGNGVATPGTDFTPANGARLTFPAGTTGSQIILVPINDAVNEPTETVELTLSDPSPNTRIGAASKHTVIISNACTIPTVSFLVSNAELTERSGPSAVSVRLSSSYCSQVSVAWRISGGTATYSTDYTSPSGTSGVLVFPAGETLQTIFIDPSEDSALENTETVQLTLSNPVNATLGAITTFTANILDASTRVFFDFGHDPGWPVFMNVPESIGVVSLPIRLSNPLPYDATVGFQVSESGAGEGRDFVLIGSPLFLPAGTTSTHLDILVEDDALFEDGEAFAVSLASLDGRLTIGDPSIVHVSIFDNDPPPGASFRTFPITPTAQEGGTAQVEVFLSAAAGADVYVPIIFSGTAQRDLDYTVEGFLNYDTLRIPAGQTNAVFSLAIVDDPYYEGGTSNQRERIVATIYESYNAVPTGTTNFTLILNDNDPPPGIRFDTATASISEPLDPFGGGISLLPRRVNIPVQLTAPAGVRIMGRVVPDGGTATVGNDFGLVSDVVLFPPGETQSVAVVNVYADLLDEPDETISFHLESPGGVFSEFGTFAYYFGVTPVSPVNYSLTILDNDATPKVSFSAAEASITEVPSAVPVKILLDRPSAATISVSLTATGSASVVSDYLFRNSSGQFSSSPPSFTFAPGETEKIFYVASVQDSNAEGDETLILSLGTINNATAGSVNQFQITIYDDDIVTLGAEAATAEGSGPGHRVRFRKATAGEFIRSVTDAETMLGLALPSPRVSFEVFDNGIQSINYVDAATDPAPRGSFGNDRDLHSVSGSPTFAPGNIDDAVMESSGYIFFPQAGDWTLTVRSDDGFRLRMGTTKSVVMEYVEGRAAGDSAMLVRIPQPGYYWYQLIWFEAFGGAEVEFFAHGPGQSANQLVGSSAGTLQVYQAIDFPITVIPELEPFVPASTGHNVDFRKANYALANITSAEALFTIPNPASDGTITAWASDQPKAINYVDGTDGAFATGNTSIATPPLTALKGTFNSGDDDDFAMRATGYIHIPTPGIWNFTVNSDDGFRLRMGRGLPEISSYFDPRGSAPTSKRVNIPTAGYYYYELIFFERAGGAQVEFYATGPGQAAPLLVGGLGVGALRAYLSGSTTLPANATVNPDARAVLSSTGHSVRFRKATGAITDINMAEALLAASLPSSSVEFEIKDNGVHTINYVDASTDPAPQGAFANDRDIHAIDGTTRFAPGNVDHFAMETSGYLVITQPGDWTFIVRSDDGFRLRMGTEDAVVMEQVNGRAPGDSAVVVQITKSGAYPYRLTYFEWAGGAQVEFSARAPGGVDRLIGGVDGLPVYYNVNVPPVLPVQVPPLIIGEEVTLTVVNTAVDNDPTPNPLTYSLLTGPSNATIDNQGIIRWTPSEGQGPGTYIFTTRVSDNDSPSLSDTNSFTVTVYEVNRPPVLDAITDRQIAPGQMLRFVAHATDADLPPNLLTFSLPFGPPGAAINPTTGEFTWRPSLTWANTTNIVRVRVQDQGAFGLVPPMIDEKTFRIKVSTVTPVTLGALKPANGLFRFEINGPAGFDYVLSSSTNLVSWNDVLTNHPGVLPFQATANLQDASRSRFFRARIQ